MEMDDGKLIARYAESKSSDAFAELMRRHLDFVYGVCRRELGDEELARDTAQAVFLVLAAKSRELGRVQSLTCWLFRTAHLACRNAVRVEARRERYERLAAREMAMSQAGADHVWAAIEPRIDEALSTLGEKDRESLLLKYVDGLTLEELGHVQNITVSAAHKRVTRALEKLRRFLNPPVSSSPVVETIDALLAANYAGHAPAGLAANIGARLFAHESSPTDGLSSVTHVYHAVLKEMLMTKIGVAAATIAAGIVLMGSAAAIVTRASESSTASAPPPGAASVVSRLVPGWPNQGLEPVAASARAGDGKQFTVALDYGVLKPSELARYAIAFPKSASRGAVNSGNVSRLPLFVSGAQAEKLLAGMKSSGEIAMSPTITTSDRIQAVISFGGEYKYNTATGTSQIPYGTKLAVTPKDLGAGKVALTILWNDTQIGATPVAGGPPSTTTTSLQFGQSFQLGLTGAWITPSQDASAPGYSVLIALVK
jgi:RNA polymerase sigma factor (sigma-70 family)